MTPLADKLRKQRRLAGLTQAELATLSGVGLATITRLEQGESREPRVSTLKKLAQALEVEIRDIYEG